MAREPSVAEQHARRLRDKQTVIFLTVGNNSTLEAEIFVLKYCLSDAY
jgi:hypothetical protein